MTDNQLENEVSITSTEWVSSREIEACQLCQGGFTTFHRKHHCRSCGHVVCGSCSSQRMTLGESSKKKRVCLSCAQVLEMLNQQMYPDLEASIHEPKSELKAILSIDTANEQALPGETWYIINRQWLQKWLEYAAQRCPESPGPISNFQLLTFQNGVLNPKTTVAIDGKGDGIFYRRVNPRVWHKLVTWYGGGPAISVVGPPVEKTDRWKIELEAPAVTEFTLELEKRSVEYEQEKLLRQELKSQTPREAPETPKAVIQQSPQEEKALEVPVLQGWLFGTNSKSKPKSSEEESQDAVTCCGFTFL